MSATKAALDYMPDTRLMIIRFDSPTGLNATIGAVEPANPMTSALFDLLRQIPAVTEWYTIRPMALPDGLNLCVRLDVRRPVPNGTHTNVMRTIRQYLPDVVFEPDQFSAGL